MTTDENMVISGLLRTPRPQLLSERCPLSSDRKREDRVVRAGYHQDAQRHAEQWQQPQVRLHGADQGNTLASLVSACV